MLREAGNENNDSLTWILSISVGGVFIFASQQPEFEWLFQESLNQFEKVIP